MKRNYTAMITGVVVVTSVLLIVLISYPFVVENKSNDGKEVPIKNVIRSNITQIIGNPTDVQLIMAMEVLDIKDAKEMVSIRFTAKYPGDVKTVVVDLASDKYNNLLVGLQKDNQGIPSGEWINKNAFGMAQQKDKGFVTIDLQQPAHLEKGKVYHLVIQSSKSNNTSDEILVKVYPANNLVQPFNDNNLDILWPDPAINTLFYNGKEWQEENKWPIFVIKYSNGMSQGQPYSLDAPWVINGDLYVGQAFTPSSDYQLEKFSFVVNANGKPQDKLYYEIRDSANQIIKKGVFAEPDQLAVAKRWIEISLDSPVLLGKDQLYRFILLSPKTDLKNSYKVIGHEFTYDNKLGYGGLQNYLTVSYDAGHSWNRWDDADTIFKLTTISYKP